MCVRCNLEALYRCQVRNHSGTFVPYLHTTMLHDSLLTVIQIHCLISSAVMFLFLHPTKKEETPPKIF
jgi:hypothetical protein